MKQPNNSNDTRIDDLPVGVRLQPLRRDRWGKVPGLDEQELACPRELERLWLRDELGPVLDLPHSRTTSFRPNVDEDGQVNWGAFGTVDFERQQATHDKMRYRIEQLREEIADQVILLDLLNQRVQVTAKWRVIKYVRMGWMDVDDIQHMELWQLAKVYLRIVYLKAQVRQLQNLRQQQRARHMQRLWAD